MGFALEFCNARLVQKTRIMISLTVSMQYTIVTDGQMDRHGTTASIALCIASRGKNVDDARWVHFGT